MAKDSKKILNESVGAFKQLTDQVKAYKNELAQLTEGTEEWNKAAEKLRNAQKKVDDINKAARGTLNTLNGIEKDSINNLKERIKLLNQERNAMDMNSKEYKQATKELKEMNDRLREAGTSAGDWKANVGNYAASISDAFTEMGTAAEGLTGSVGGLNAGLLKLASNPVGAAVVAIAAAVRFLAEGIKSSEENTNRWNLVLVPLKTVLVMIQKASQDAAEKFLDFAENVEKSEKAGNILRTALKILITMFEQTKTRLHNLKEALTTAGDALKTAFGKGKEWVEGVEQKLGPIADGMKKVGKAIKEWVYDKVMDLVGLHNKIAASWFGKLLGLQTREQIRATGEAAEEATEEIVKEYKETKNGVQEVTEASNKAKTALRGLGHQATALRGEIEKLNAEYAEALEQEDYEKAQEILDERIEKEKKLADTQVAIAGTQLNLIRLQNSLSESSTKDLDAQAQAEDAVADAKMGVWRATEEQAKAQKQLNRLIKAKEEKEQAEALKKEVNALNSALEKLTGNYNSALSAIQKPLRPEGGDITYDSLNSYYDQIKANAKAEYDAYKELTDAKIAELERFLAAQREAGVEEEKLATQALQLQKLKQEQESGYAAQYKKMTETQTAADKERTKSVLALQKSEIQGYANLFDAVSGLFEQNTIAYKATATAKALINTYLAASSALAETPGDAIAKGVAAAAVVAQGLAQVISIWKVNPKGETNIPTAGSSVSAAAEPNLPQENPYTYTRTIQTYEEEDLLNRPQFVSVVDINRVQNAVRVTDQESSF